MCGITGFCDFSRKLTRDHLYAANEALHHRGPDSGDIALFDASEANIGFGHRRLSIMDVTSNGSQPMYSDDKSVVIILNGEIYNFKEIREDLLQKGYKFHSDSDTEVVLKCYQEYGIGSVEKFIGMFAYAIYDQPKQELYILRDRAGVKPLYYYHANNTLLFASELKSFHAYPLFEKKIEPQAVSLFFKYGYIRDPFTIFQNTHKVRPGHYIKIDIRTKTVTDHKYWDVVEHYNKPKIQISEEEATAELEKLFRSAFEYRMVSDVPVGVFLSGGYDSTLVTAILQANSAQKIKTFTIGFHEKKWNEAPYAKEIAAHLGTDHHEYYCTTKEAQDIFPQLADIYDEPFGDSSGIPTTLVSRFARKQVTVSLSADGGDEIFAGYNKYQQMQKLNNYLLSAPGPLLALGKGAANLSMKAIPGLRRFHKVERLTEILNTYRNAGLSDIYSRQYKNNDLYDLLPGYNDKLGLFDEMEILNSGNDFINKSLAYDYRTYMVDDILTKVDRATMSVALEGREPLLDHRIIEFASQLPSNLKYHNGEKKYLVKKIVHKYIPKEVMDRPKTGFSIPVFDWLTGDLKDHLYSLINEKEFAKHGLIDIKKAMSVRKEFEDGRKGRDAQIWLLLMFQMWWNRWM
ncbi:MAG TPA: asparagine synthase (glutamine-hydrolyzing) [Chitinophagaceae bacterium]|nr:asparagine synthase (glutamine-hydrolyzing) [Chitinophagaceae bacterium]HPH30264.1 asparagine synthase (glutamine-hydrolyzing) [Chitinophagaceae bacterium]